MKKYFLLVVCSGIMQMYVAAQKNIATQPISKTDTRTGEHILASEFLIPAQAKPNSNARIFNALETLQGKVLSYTLTKNNILIIEHIQSFKPEELLQFFRTQNIGAKYKDPILNRFLFLNDNGKLVHE
jgi:hypothetical protein